MLTAIYRRAFTLVELLAVIVIISILAAILLPVVGKIKNNGYTAKTVANLRQLQIANMAYANDHNGFFVKNFDGSTFQNGWFWNTDYLPYLGKKTAAEAAPLFRSGFPQASAKIAYNIPKVPNASGSGNAYFYQVGALELKSLQFLQPSKTIAFLDCNDWWVNPDQWNKWVSAESSDKSNIPPAAVAYRNAGNKAAAVTFAGNTVMLSREELNTSTPEGQARWWFDCKQY